MQSKSELQRLKLGEFYTEHTQQNIYKENNITGTEQLIHKFP